MEGLEGFIRLVRVAALSYPGGTHQGRPLGWGWGTRTCLLVPTDQELKDAVHGPHVEDEPQLCDTHGNQAEQQDGAEHAVHE